MLVSSHQTKPGKNKKPPPSLKNTFEVVVAENDRNCNFLL
nr:MAG TPA: hypothetical protein [Bacteriophage sp.]